MNNSKNTKHAFLASFLSMLMCIAMLVGSTFAWFTDSVVSSDNKILSGNLNIDLLVKDENGEYKSVKSTNDPIFSYENWEPGYTVFKNLKVTTSGNLALKYKMDIIAKGEISLLADVIDVYYASEEINNPDRTLTGFEYLGTLSSILKGKNTVVEGGLNPDNKDSYITLALKMKESADNKYQGLSVDNFDVNIVATQDRYESDSFDNSYDNEAIFPTYVATEGEIKEAINNVEDGGTIVLNNDIALSEALTVDNKKIQIDLNGKTLNTTDNCNLIQANGTASVSVSNGSLYVDNNETSAVLIAEDNAKVYINNCKINYSNGKGYAIVTNGSNSRNVNLVISDSVIVAEKNYACYFPAGNIVMNNCDVKGAIIISGGDVTIDGGTYTADGFNGQPKIWHKDDTINYMRQFSSLDGCGHMGDSILIMDRRSVGYGSANVTVQNVVFNTELNLTDGNKATAYAIKYVDYNNIEGVERGRLNIVGNTYNHKLDNEQEPLMFIGIDGSDISVQ